ncbi:sulfur carrier protein adenylyltransferase [Neocloeon triangulifer]|uniref:sulfur carrier protein adenylyltransferase n=1 Tax=Neocloeon triangulifer TaxID=2078957 RepID=UPI00286FABDB|nr:sulfur carrier protein adenylyltransferase [Neocloeon triangulifer]
MHTSHPMADNIGQLEREVAQLKRLLVEKEELLANLKVNSVSLPALIDASEQNLSKEDVVRFSRQIILPQVGVSGQVRLKKSSVLVVGAGGLGCPVLLYLVKAGIGRITVVDSDLVEISNLHRQTLHSDATIGLPKVDSACRFFALDQSYANVIPICERFTPENADRLVSEHDVIVDATDNVGSRYLLNDACVRHKKPLVSGSALGLEGQLTVYNGFVKKDGALVKGPCYRCLFPEPPPAASATSCSQSGVLGAVPGLIGLMQSIEVIKLIVDWPQNESVAGRMILLDANDLSLRTVRLRLANEKCPACSSNPQKNLPYYIEMCGEDVPVKALEDHERVTPDYVKAELDKLLLVDVRTEGEFGMCAIQGSVNFPFKDFEQILPEVKKAVLEAKQNSPSLQVCFVCRRGNDSQLAAVRFKEAYPEDKVVDMKGGLHAWAKVIDDQFPVY